MHQLLLGASIPLLAALVVYVRRRGRATLAWLIATPLAALAGALWAVVPDIPRLMGMPTLYHRLARERWTDLFFWHYSIDQIEERVLTRIDPLFTALFALLLVGLLTVALRELARREKGEL